MKFTARRQKELPAPGCTAAQVTAASRIPASSPVQRAQSGNWARWRARALWSCRVGATLKTEQRNVMDFYEGHIAQLQLPDLADADPHPRLLLEGRGIHVGERFSALFPDGWHDITLEVSWEPTGPGCWYISTLGFGDICPIGLFAGV